MEATMIIWARARIKIKIKTMKTAVPKKHTNKNIDNHNHKSFAIKTI